MANNNRPKGLKVQWERLYAPFNANLLSKLKLFVYSVLSFVPSTAKFILFHSLSSFSVFFSSTFFTTHPPSLHHLRPSICLTSPFLHCNLSPSFRCHRSPSSSLSYGISALSTPTMFLSLHPSVLFAKFNSLLFFHLSPLPVDAPPTPHARDVPVFGVRGGGGWDTGWMYNCHGCRHGREHRHELSDQRGRGAL